MTCEIDVNTSISGNSIVASISGNVINVNSSTVSLGAPIVLSDSLTIAGGGMQLPNIVVSSGVQFVAGIDSGFTIGGLGSNTASFTNSTSYKGLFIPTNEKSAIIPVTNLNQLSIGVNTSGSKVSYFAVTISGA